MFLAFFLLWIIFNGRFTLEIAVFGLVIAAACYALICKVFGFDLKTDLRLLKKLPAMLKLFGVLVIEIFKANFQVIHWIYRPEREMDPEIVQFTVDLKTEAARVALADCITLTPGTITGSLEDNVYVVHCLDRSMAEGLDQSIFVRILKELEGIGGEHE